MKFIKETKFEGSFRDPERSYRGVYYVDEYATVYRLSFRPFGVALPILVDCVVKKSILRKNEISIYDFVDKFYNL